MSGTEQKRLRNMLNLPFRTSRILFVFTGFNEYFYSENTWSTYLSPSLYHSLSKECRCPRPRCPVFSMQHEQNQLLLPPSASVSNFPIPPSCGTVLSLWLKTPVNVGSVLFFISHIQLFSNSCGFYSCLLQFFLPQSWLRCCSVNIPLIIF